MKHPLFIFFLLCSFITNAQTDTSKVIGIHRAVGKVISRQEKTKYNLFPEYKTSAFDSAQIVKTNENLYQAVIYTSKGTVLKNYISTKELDEMYFRIDDVEKKKNDKNEEYILSAEEKKKMRQKEVAREVGSVFLNIFGQMLLTSFEIFLTYALSN